MSLETLGALPWSFPSLKVPCPARMPRFHAVRAPWPSPAPPSARSPSPARGGWPAASPSRAPTTARRGPLPRPPPSRPSRAPAAPRSPPTTTTSSRRGRRPRRRSARRTASSTTAPAGRWCSPCAAWASRGQRTTASSSTPAGPSPSLEGTLTAACSAPPCGCSTARAPRCVAWWRRPAGAAASCSWATRSARAWPRWRPLWRSGAGSVGSGSAARTWRATRWRRHGACRSRSPSSTRTLSTPSCCRQVFAIESYKNVQVMASTTILAIDNHRDHAHMWNLCRMISCPELRHPCSTFSDLSSGKYALMAAV